MSRRSLLGVLALTGVVYCAGVAGYTYTGDFLSEALVHAAGFLVRFWWWILPTGAGLGMLLPAIATGVHPPRAALLGSLVAIPVAATIFVAVLIEDAMSPKFDVVFIEINGARIVMDDVATTARRIATLSVFVAAPACAVVAFLLARQEESESARA